MKQTIQLRHGMQLTMTPQLQQAIRLLQLSALDLQQEVQEALDSNLMLETEEEGRHHDPPERLERPEGGPEPEHAGIPEEQGEEWELNPERAILPEDLPVDSEWGDTYDSYASNSGQREEYDGDPLAQKCRAETLQDHLIWQLNLTPFSDIDRVVALAIIDAINEDGYLSSPLEEIHGGLGNPDLELDEMVAVLHRIQAFDPVGVAARDLRECLLLQIRQLSADTPNLDAALLVCDAYFDLFAKQNYGQIKQDAHLEDEDLQGVMRLLRTLNPRPGTQVAEVCAQYVIPDILVTRRNGAWHVELNPEATPRLRVNPEYAKLIRRADQTKDNTYLKNHLQEARWFIKSLSSRNETVLRVATQIVKLQRGFFEHGPEAMKPLVLREVAKALEMHESTVSRVTTQKYLRSPRGTFELKFFFSSHVRTANGGECSATAIRALLKKLIAAEQPGHPLSDDKLAQILANQGIDVARRTVAKYRESMGILSSTERKRLL